MNHVAPRTIKLSIAKGHASLLPSFSLENSLYFDVNGSISLQKLVGNFSLMTLANLGKQHHIDFKCS